MRNFKYIIYSLFILSMTSCSEDDSLDFTPTYKVGFITASTSTNQVDAEDSIKIQAIVSPETATLVDISIDGDELIYGEHFITFPAVENNTLTAAVDENGVAEFYFIGSDIDISRDNEVVFTIAGASNAELGQQAALSHSLMIESLFVVREKFNDCDTGLPAGWTVFSESSDANWGCSDNQRGDSSNSGDYALEMTGLQADVASTDWVISPELTLEENQAYTLQFSSMKRFTGPDLAIKISTNYSGGDPNTATWLPFTAAESQLDQDEASYDYRESAAVTIPETGNVHIAFIYTSTGTGADEASLYRIDNFRIGVSEQSGVIGLLNENFDDCDALNSFTTVSVVGDQEWSCNSNGIDSDAVRMNGYADGVQDNEDWLISPPVSLSEDATLTFSTDVGYNGPALEVMISTNYSGSGNPNSADWEAISATLDDDSDFDTWTSSGNIDLSSYTGQTIYVAFVYTSSSDDGAAQWTVENVVIE